MGVIVKGMKMPENCEMCAIKSWDDDGYVCPFSGVMTLSIGRQDACPLVEVPTPHGRLVDIDEVEKCINETEEFDGKELALVTIEWAMEKRVVLEEEGENE